VALEMYGHKIFKSYEKNINIFIAPSEFAKAELIKFGLSEDKIKVINHFAAANKTEVASKIGDYLLSFGRIAENKGLDKLLHAMYISKLSCKLKIAGSGPYLSEIRKLIIDYHLNNVELLGHLNTAELNKQIAGAMAIVVPSVVWETFGLTVLEAYAQEKIVIANRAGALPEIIKEGETGYLYASENELIEKINLVINNKERLINLGSNAKKFLQTKYNPENHYQQLLAVYCGLRPDQP
jgi:glycosyltransferase involved in cell wall biosynthesis